MSLTNLGGSFWQKDSLITPMKFSPVANLMHQPLLILKDKIQWNNISLLALFWCSGRYFIRGADGSGILEEFRNNSEVVCFLLLEILNTLWSTYVLYMVHIGYWLMMALRKPQILPNVFLALVFFCPFWKRNLSF